MLKVDVTNYERIEEVKREINIDLGTVDILVNNAGIIPKHSLRDGKPSDIQRLIDINVMANFWVKLNQFVFYLLSVKRWFNLMRFIGIIHFSRQHEFSSMT